MTAKRKVTASKGARRTASGSPEAQLDAFLDRYSPEVAGVAREALGRLRRRLPTSIEMVYDNYNALAIGFGPTERASDAVLSVALYPRWVSLFFLRGSNLPDPKGLLKGSGKVVRSINLAAGTSINDADVEALVDAAVAAAPRPFAPSGAHRIVIKSVSAKQRPRRPQPIR